MRVALVYDRLNKIGGAEKVLQAFSELYPEADWYTSLWDKEGAPFSKKWQVHTSWINKIPFLRRHHEWIPFFMPFVFESFNFNGYDLVISIGSAECKGIITRPETHHLHYCLTPTRYLYSHRHEYLHNKLHHWIAKYLGAWDQVAATRPDHVISISEQVKNRVKKYYNRDSDVIYPPVDLSRFNSSLHDNQLPDYYLIVSRLVPYKNIDLAVRAFNKNGKKLVIVGTGSEFHKLKKLAKRNITFTGQLSDPQVIAHYHQCRAYLQCNEEDFGISMVEAQAAGKPVIAYAQGGASEIVTDSTGVLYNELSVSALNAAIDKSETIIWQPQACIKNARKFDKVKWLDTMKERISHYGKEK